MKRDLAGVLGEWRMRSSGRGNGEGWWNQR